VNLSVAWLEAFRPGTNRKAGALLAGARRRFAANLSEGTHYA
jgi:hypothetical protein